MYGLSCLFESSMVLLELLLLGDQLALAANTDGTTEEQLSRVDGTGGALFVY